MVLGGAFFVNGNINPAAEANIFGDPEAADFVLGQPATSIRMVGLDVTHEVTLPFSCLARAMPEVWPCLKTSIAAALCHCHPMKILIECRAQPCHCAVRCI